MMTERTPVRAFATVEVAVVVLMVIVALAEKHGM